MNAMILCGSRNSQGQTAQAADALRRGLGQGATSEVAFLPTMKIERCRQCDPNGWGVCRSEGRCVIQDDFAGLAAKIKAADAVVFANPVYFGDLSESLKAFLDRLRRICRHDTGKAGITDKPAVGICVAGGGGGGAPECTVILNRTLTTCGFNVVDVIPIRRQNLQMKLAVLETVGRWLAESAPPKAAQ